MSFFFTVYIEDFHVMRKRPEPLDFREQLIKCQTAACSSRVSLWQFLLEDIKRIYLFPANKLTLLI